MIKKTIVVILFLAAAGCNKYQTNEEVILSMGALLTNTLDDAKEIAEMRRNKDEKGMKNWFAAGQLFQAGVSDKAIFVKDEGNNICRVLKEYDHKEYYILCDHVSR